MIVKKIVVTVLCAIVCLLCLMGCKINENQCTAEEKNLLECVYEKGPLREYVDSETGVHYFLINSGNGVALVPRYDENGNIYIERGATEDGA